MSSSSVQNVSAALRDAANAAVALGRVVNTLSDVLNSIANVEARLQALELAIHHATPVEARGNRERLDFQPTVRGEMRSHVDTNTAARLLGRASQTLRKWACYEDGPLRPVRVNGRLAWPVADIRQLLNDV